MSHEFAIILNNVYAFILQKKKKKKKEKEKEKEKDRGSKSIHVIHVLLGYDPALLLHK